MKRLLAFVAALAASGVPAFAADPDVTDWATVLEEARGQIVYWNAWAGSEQINAYIGWVGKALYERHGVKLVHVKVDDTGNAVSAVVSERTAGRDTDGSIDLIWINGENFASMKRQGLLFEPGWATHLPNWRYVDAENKPTITTDFTIPTEGLESPWGMAKMVFFYDSARTEQGSLPDSADELLDWVKANPGRFSYPQPPDFIGSSFLKQVLLETTPDPAALLKPAEEADFDAVAGPLFDYLDEMHPYVWRGAKTFPKDYPSMSQLLADGELDITFAFNPGEASSAIANDLLPHTVRSFTFTGGTLSNTHFVAIPYNAASKAGALVLANFLISPEAQIRKQDPTVWGDPTVLSMDLLSDEDRTRFADLDLGIATLAPDQLGPVLAEPHPSWVAMIEQEWAKRYGVAN
ncbi:ABC transporter substrate-binding protein [Oricola cellulosilytica]|uniref:ABC transporter substrate-binding protein n=1 Tax=Oricola cellulosilytica TaxID=1429082 RepID=A0A4R0PF89_9HYPH|nr:ABC transporter substrate-binding protein [Oricola cellulosilytica]TCD16291.1 ABC transporter substrate-binding protein [Oricola cellulosilytica]